MTNKKRYIHTPKSDFLDIYGGLTMDCLGGGFQLEQLELNLQSFPRQQQQQVIQQQQSPQQQQQLKQQEFRQEPVATPTIVENGVDIVIFKGYDHGAEVRT